LAGNGERRACASSEAECARTTATNLKPAFRIGRSILGLYLPCDMVVIIRDPRRQTTIKNSGIWSLACCQLERYACLIAERTSKQKIASAASIRLMSALPEQPEAARGNPARAHRFVQKRGQSFRVSAGQFHRQ
jgi:hypothetical protein